jgi:fructan beta-fructosidase
MYKAIVYLVLSSLMVACNSSGQPDSTEATPDGYRPAYHYTPEKNWVNDPNGLVYLDGEYHLFYQYNPYGDTWGHMSWGHAVSKDLKTWEELPVALEEYPSADSSETMIFSGSVVVDSENTSGFFEPGFKNGMVAIYTSHVHRGDAGLAQHQSLAYSSDKGRTWKYYDQNPVLDLNMKDFRDPNVFRYQGKWKMIVVKPLDYVAQIYESENLKDWKLLSEFGKMGDMAKIWECPSLFEVPVADSDEKKWVMLISSAAEDTEFTGMQYFVGDFDGQRFTPQPQEGVFRLDNGKDFYAAIPYNNLPDSQKNPIIVGWVNNWMYANQIPASGSRGMFSMPRILSLKKQGDTYVIIQRPIVKDGVSTKTISVKAKDLAEQTFDMPTNSYRLTLTIDLSDAQDFTIDLLKKDNQSTPLRYDAATGKLSIDRTKSGDVAFHERFPSVESVSLNPKNKELKLDIFADNSVLEIFVNDGEKVLTELVFPGNGASRVAANAD